MGDFKKYVSPIVILTELSLDPIMLSGGEYDNENGDNVYDWDLD